MKRSAWLVLLQVACGIALVAVAVHLLGAWMARERASRVPAGNSVLRPPDDVSSLLLVDGTIWAGGKQGLFIFAADGAALAVPEPLRKLHFVAALLREANGGIWIAHEDGLTHWQDQRVRHFSTLAGAFPGRGLSVLRDRDGRLWAGSDRQLVQLDGAVFKAVALPEAFGLTEAAVLYQDRAGTLWIGDGSARSPGLISLDRGKFRLYTRQNGLPHHAINSIIQRKNSADLWIGSGFAGAGGAVLMDQQQWRSVGPAQGLAGDKVRSIFEDSRGRLWFGSEYNGAAVFGAQRLAVLTEDDGLAGPEVKAILEHPLDTFWLGTNGGLSRITRFNATQGDPRFPGF